jgi:hypothetical protein
MKAEAMETANNGSWKQKALILGGVIGALAGVGVAYMLIRQAEENESRMQFGTGEGVQLGLILANLFRQVARLRESPN